MVKMGKLIIVTTVSIFMIFPTVQESVSADLTEEQVVYNKFFKATGTEAQHNQLINILYSQFQQGFSQGINETAKDAEGLTAEEMAEFKKTANEVMAEYISIVKQKIGEIMPFNELVKNVYIPVYKKHFTLDEIREVTKFYEGEVGQKFVTLAPKMMQESVMMINTKYNEQIMQISLTESQKGFAKIKAAMEKIKNKTE